MCLHLPACLLLFICNFTARLDFQRGSQCMLESLYLMCRGKHHKSQRHSSIFFDGSPNHSVGEKADTSLFDWAQIGSYLAMDSSGFWLIYQAQSSAQRLQRWKIFSCTEVCTMCFWYTFSSYEGLFGQCVV